MYLFLDTETASLPADYNAPETDLHNWPRLVQLGWVLSETPDIVLAREEFIIKPAAFLISPAAIDVHGISNERALDEGLELDFVLDRFGESAERAKVLVGHNLQFDARILGAEYLRLGRKNPLKRKRRVCTMKDSVDYCRLPGRRGYKWPTLMELHRKLFQTDFAGAHGALADCEACCKCFFQLKELGVVE